MLNLAWSLLNLVLLLLFIYAWLKVLQALQEHIGIRWTAIFAVGLLLTTCSSSSKPDTGRKNLLARNESSNLGLANTSMVQHNDLGPSTGLIVLAEAQRTEQSIVPRGLYVTTSGLMYGHSWEPVIGMTNQVPGGRLRYNVMLMHKWYLLNLPVFTSSEEYEGVLAEK